MAIIQRFSFVLTIFFSFIFFSKGQGITENERSILELMDKKKIEFAATKNDSIFVTENSDSPYRYIYLTRGDEPEDVEDEIFNAKPGDVIGPFRSEEHIYIFKVLSFDSIRTRTRASHIFIKKGDKKDSAAVLSTAQKIVKSLNKGDDFSALATKEGSDFKETATLLGFNSEIVASDGDLGWIWEGKTIPEINEALLKAKKGEAVLAQSPYGAHVFQVKDKSKGFYKTTIISVVKETK